MRPSIDCILLIGGNIGDRKRKMIRAATALNHLPESRVLRRSRLYETAAIGKSRRPYLNLAVKLRTRFSPMGLLIECKRLEAMAGRKPGPRWGDRPLDIDILSYGRQRIKTRWLTIPHPLIAERAFALAPLADIAPRWKPDGKTDVKTLLRRLNPGPETVKIYRPHPR